jgi:Na+/pantothenate symporter
MENKKEGLAITSFVTSIVALFAFGLPLGMTAVITGYLSRKESKLGKAGFIIGIVDLALVAIGIYMQL